MWQILLPKDIEGQEIAIYVKMVMKSLRDSEKTFQKKKKNEYRWAAKTLPIKGTARQKSSHQEMSMEWLRWEFYKTVSRHWKMWSIIFNILSIKTLPLSLLYIFFSKALIVYLNYFFVIRKLGESLKSCIPPMSGYTQNIKIPLTCNLRETSPSVGFPVLPVSW